MSIFRFVKKKKMSIFFFVSGKKCSNGSSWLLASNGQVSGPVHQKYKTKACADPQKKLLLSIKDELKHRVNSHFDGGDAALKS